MVYAHNVYISEQRPFITVTRVQIRTVKWTCRVYIYGLFFSFFRPPFPSGSTAIPRPANPAREPRVAVSGDKNKNPPNEIFIPLHTRSKNTGIYVYL